LLAETTTQPDARRSGQAMCTVNSVACVSGSRRRVAQQPALIYVNGYAGREANIIGA